MPAPVAPEEGMAMSIPVGRRRLDGSADFLPGRKAMPLEGERAQDLPPWFDQIQVGGVLRLEDELPARMGEGKEQDVSGAVGAQMVENGVDALHLRVDPRLG